MTLPNSLNTPKKNKVPEPITAARNRSSLNSSSSSVSPSASVLLSLSSRTFHNSSSMSQSSFTSARIKKSKQIIQNFYTKTAQIIIQSRKSNEKRGSRLNKWFNITTNESETLKDELRFWKDFVQHGKENEIPPLIIDIYLETSEPELLQEGDDTRGWYRLNTAGAQRILLESWTLSLNHPMPDFHVDLPNLYKKSIVFFRSLHSLVRLLPSHTLYHQLNVHDGEISMGYRLSAHKFQTPNEIDFDHVLSNVDTINQYEFKDVLTPLGTLNLKLLYRKNCQYNTREDNTAAPSLPVIDVDENFFTPTMTQHRHETERMNPVIRPSLSTCTRLESYRSNRYLASTAALERRISAPIVQPFKSPSLSSSPQAEFMLTSSRSHTPEKSQLRSESGSLSRKIEFSSSFEKFKTSSNNSSVNRPAPDMMRRWSRTSDHSSIYMESEDEEDLQDFMKLLTAKQDLKLFQPTVVYDPPKLEVVEDLKHSLTHFRNVQETHTILSDSVSFSVHPTLPTESSQPHLPPVPSPLHRTESAKMVHRQHSQSQETAVQAFKQQQMTEGFFSYPRGQPNPLTTHQADVVAQSPLKNRQAPPLPPPPSAPTRRVSTSVGDDDDSLMFKMSELSADYEEEVSKPSHSNPGLYFDPF